MPIADIVTIQNLLSRSVAALEPIRGRKEPDSEAASHLVVMVLSSGLVKIQLARNFLDCGSAVLSGLGLLGPVWACVGPGWFLLLLLRLAAPSGRFSGPSGPSRCWALGFGAVFWGPFVGPLLFLCAYVSAVGSRFP